MRTIELTASPADRNDVRQPREHSVRCFICLHPTFRRDALCTPCAQAQARRAARRKS